MSTVDTTIRVDFNNLKPGLLLRIGLSRIEQPHGIGIAEKRMFRDFDGSTCWGAVEALNETFATFRLDMSTWKDPE